MTDPSALPLLDVRGDVAPSTNIGGVAVRPIRERSPRPAAERRRRLAWWHWPHDAPFAALRDLRTSGAESILDRHEGGSGEGRR